ncbi:hypothetical protein Hypma_007382 [Hypsizygus marmoreus]|uniref:Uncharacterized protein n=1 Tax=Hypsizygus marmoreus TaxID=39966 RepID=A0A369JWH4_HYPMA|nr:hypothetical protein Hypma_007382 [Hypsizygus marmoreus]
MRASIDIYEHPQLSSSDVWPKDSSATRTCLYSVLGVFSLAAVSTFAAWRYASLGQSIHDSSLLRHWL